MNTLQSLKKRKKGFTLTELAIVIAVIAILIAVLVPTFTSVITKARVTAAAEEAKNAISSYMIETNKGLNDGTCVAVDDTYYFEVNGNTVSTDSNSYSTSNSAVSGLCPYQWDEDGDAYSTYNGKVTVYIDEDVVVLPTTYSFTTKISNNNTTITVDNSKLTITNSGSTYTISGTLGSVDGNFRKWWWDNDSTTETTPTSAFYIRTYLPVASSAIKSISTSTKTWDGTTTNNPQTLSEILEEEDGACYVDWILNGTTTQYKITYNYTIGDNESQSGSITIYNNAKPVSA